MIENKLKVGRYITLNPNPPPPGAYAPGDILTQTPLPLQIQESEGVFTKKSVVTPGANAVKVHRNFQWLEYLPGALTQVPLNGVDVLTGPMSGCRIMLHRSGGVVNVVHVGTENTRTSANSVAAKTAWNALAALEPRDVLGGFNALDGFAVFPAQLPPPKGDDAQPYIYALVTQDQRFYAVFTYIQLADNKRHRIAGIQQMPSVPVANLLVLT